MRHRRVQSSPAYGQSSSARPRWITRRLGLLVCTTCLVVAARAATGAERHALLIGISDYAHLPDLEGPASDVRALRETLVTRWDVPPGHVRTLVDAQATKASVKRELKRLHARTSPGDEVIIYYSGHGTSRYDPETALPLPHASGALVPVDFEPTGSVDEQMERLLVGRWDLRPLLEALDRGGRETFVAIDACFSGNAVRSGAAAGRLPVRFVPLGGTDTTPRHRTRERTGEKAPYPYRGVVFLSAAAEHEFAADIGTLAIDEFPTRDGRPHGAFTDALLRVMNWELAADRNHDGAITYGELRDEVRAFLARRGFAQRPQLLPGDEAIAMVVARRATVGPTASEARLTRLARKLADHGTGRLEIAVRRTGTSPVLTAGERVSFSLMSDVAGYPALIAIDADGSLSLLFPYDLSQLRSLRVAEPLFVPAENPASGFSVEPPFGRVVVVALAYRDVAARLVEILERPSATLALSDEDVEALLDGSPSPHAVTILALTTAPSASEAGRE